MECLISEVQEERDVEEICDTNGIAGVAKPNCTNSLLFIRIMPKEKQYRNLIRKVVKRADQLFGGLGVWAKKNGRSPATICKL